MATPPTVWTLAGAAATFVDCAHSVMYEARSACQGQHPRTVTPLQRACKYEEAQHAVRVGGERVAALLRDFPADPVARDSVCFSFVQAAHAELRRLFVEAGESRDAEVRQLVEERANRVPE